MKTFSFSWLLFCLITCVSHAQHTQPKIQLATNYQVSADISQYWVSEKLDGVRGFWDGKHMYTKRGNRIYLPKYFTNNWPNQPLEGELWIKRGNFESISALIRTTQMTESAWQHVKFMLFDLPNHSGTFTERIKAMKTISLGANNRHLQVIDQYKVTNNKLLTTWLEATVSSGGEGLMLHKADAKYHQGRTTNVMKLKPIFDAEAEVIAHIAGQGKYSGKLGALKVRTSNGVTFKIGSGFSDQERENPPPIGSIITFKYSGKTHKGVPRFASFLRIRYLASLKRAN